MNFRHLRTFVAIANAGGISHAAAKLNMGQPTVSRQIQALEAELGVRLFNRTGRRVQLTTEGEDLLRRCQDLLTEVESFAERARSLTKGHTGILRVGATPQVIESVLAQFIMAYQRSHRGVEIKLVEDGGARLPRRLEQGDVHLALMPPTEGFHSKLLFPMHLIAVVPQNHRLAKARHVEIADLAAEPLMVLSRNFASRHWFEEACLLARLEPRVVFESAAPHVVIALARARYGVALIPSPVAVPRTGVHGLPVVRGGASVGRWLTIAWDPRRFLAPYAQQFVDDLIASAGRTYPGQELTHHVPPLPRPKTVTG